MQRSILANVPLFLLLLALSFLTFSFDRLGIFGPAKNAVGFVAVPVQSAIFNFSQKMKLEFATFLQVRQIAQDYQKLQEDYAKLLAEHARLSAVQQENKILRSQFEVQPDLAPKLLPAQVIGLSKNLLIDQGSQAGVKTGQVVTLKNTLIGQVIAESANFATVQLPTSPQSSITAYVESPGGSKGVVTGSFGSTMVVEKILPEEHLEVGQLVFTAGEEERGNIPKGLILGKISKVEKKEAAVFQSAEIEPLFKFDQLRLVFVDAT